jgi:Flp pilus assembly protein TadD
MKEDAPDVDSLAQMVEDDPEDAEAWLAYGKALLEVNRNGEAVQALEKALELNPNAVDTRYHLGDALAEDGRLEAAAQQFWYLASDDPELKEPLSVPGLSALMRMAECQGALGRWSEAVSTVLPAVSLAVDSLAHVAYIHQKAGAHEQAAALYSICLLLTPEDPGLLHGAGYNKMKLGDLEEALNDLGQALKLDPKTSDIWYDYGIVLARLKRRSEARPIFRKVLRLDAKFFWAWYDLACLDALEGKPVAAFRNLNRAVDCGFKDAAYLLQDQDFHGIHEDPRWEMILSRIGEPAPGEAHNGKGLLSLNLVHGIQ